MQQHEHAFYVYVLARPSGKAFYVGKGKGPRVFKHEEEARRGHVCHKCNVIRKIWRNGGEVQRYIIFTTNDEQEAFDHERALIALIGREQLTNGTDGGDGTSGAVLPDSFRAKLRARQRIYWQNPSYRARVLAAMYQRQATPEYRAKLSASIKRARSSPAWQAKSSAFMKARWNDPDYRAKMLAMLQAHKDNPALCAKMSAKMTADWQDPAQREKLLSGIKARWEDPSERARAGENSRARWQDPDQRAHMIARMKASRTPEYSAKMSAAKKAYYARKHTTEDSE